MFSLHQGELAINVKDHVAYAHHEPYASLIEKLPDEVVQRAYRISLEDFWELAAKEAARFGYGEVYAEGRSGGWLHVFNPQKPTTRELAERWQHFEANIIGLVDTARDRFLQRLKEELSTMTTIPHYDNVTTPPQGLKLRGNMYLPAAIAEALVAAMPAAAQVEVRPDSGDTSYIVPAINAEHVPAIAEVLQEVIAYTVSTLIDAGSERDAVMENDELRQVIEKELVGWTNPFE